MSETKNNCLTCGDEGCKNTPCDSYVQKQPPTTPHQWPDLLPLLKVGMYVWTIFDGWTKITSIAEATLFPIGVSSRTYTCRGFIRVENAAPSLYINPPDFFHAGPKPCEFKKGERVLVKDIAFGEWDRRYFSHEEGGKFFCFLGGQDEWASGGTTSSWPYCIPYSEEAENENE